MNLGIIFAFTAFIAWGFGDFFAQKSIRRVGSWKSLFFDCCFGVFGLLIFVLKDIFLLSIGDMILLSLTSVVAISASLFDFEALKQGKISIIEPIIGLEIPLTVALSFILVHESMNIAQVIIIFFVFIGVILAITEHHTELNNKTVFEKGVILALVGAICMALSNTLVGVSSREISPLMTIWFTDFFIAIICMIYFIITKEYKDIFSKLKSNAKIIIGHGVFDTSGYVAFAFSTLYIPIAITTTISEGYVALAAFLGLAISHEKIKKHQFIGVALAIMGVIALAYFS